MTHYLDTSAIVTALTKERHTEQMRRWLGDQPGGSLFISHWGLTEVSSALSLKVRTGALPLDQRNEVLAGWQMMAQDVFRILEVTVDDFSAATLMVAQHDLGLRAGDALHIAVARAAGCALVTLDRAMAAAATALGVSLAEV